MGLSVGAHPSGVSALAYIGACRKIQSIAMTHPALLSAEAFLNVVSATPLVAVDLVVVRGGSEILLGLQLAALPQAPGLLGAYEHFYQDCFAGSAQEVGVSTHYVVLGHLVQVPVDFALPAFDAQHADLRWWPLAEALAGAAVHRFTKDYVETILLSK